MRFVPIKTAECQAALMLKTRDLLVRQRTPAINAVRGHFAELGIVAAKGLAKVEMLIQSCATGMTNGCRLRREWRSIYWLTRSRC
jgi:transposase